MRKVLIWLVILGLLIWAVTVLADNSKKNSMDQSDKDSSLAPQTQKDDSGRKMAFGDFLNYDDKPYKCSVTAYESDMENKATIYTNAGKIRGEYKTIAEGKELTTFFIVNDGYQYVWQNNTEAGVKIAYDGKVDIKEASGVYTWNASQVGEYECEPWVPSENTFELPGSVKFMEINQR